MKAKRAARPSTLERTAYHEAGHAAASFLLGRRVLSVTIIRDDVDRSLGVCRSPPAPVWLDPYWEPTEGQRPRSDGRKRTWIEMEILILFAGGAAETRFSGRRNFIGARQDRSSAINLAGLLYSDTAELEAYLRWLAIRADNLLKGPGTWEAVEAIAEGLLERRKLTGRQARKLYQAGRENAFRRFMREAAAQRKPTGAE